MPSWNVDYGYNVNSKPERKATNQPFLWFCLDNIVINFTLEAMVIPSKSRNGYLLILPS